jgi:SHOCT-like domain
MSRQVIETGPAPDILIEKVLGDLQVRGWENPQVAVNADPDELDLQQQDGNLRLSCRGDCDLYVPQGAALTLGSVLGDASLKMLGEQLIIDQVHGDLDLRSIAAVQINLVHGDLAAKNISHDLIIEQVMGDADIRHAQGQSQLSDVDGNLDLLSVEGEIKANVRGNARLRLDHLTGATYRVQADGNIYCYLPVDANLKISLVSQGEVIKVRLPDSSKTYKQATHELTLGDGSASLSLNADGSIYLFVERASWPTGEDEATGSVGIPPDFGQQIAQQVEAQINSQMEEMTRNLNQQMSMLSARLGQAGLAAEETDRIVEKTMRNSERERERAEEKMRRAQEKLERKLEAQRQRTERRAQEMDRRTRRSTLSFEWPSPPKPPVPPKPPTPSKSEVTEEERLLILKMLEQKKISLEEADRLLSALEGND